MRTRYKVNSSEYWPLKQSHLYQNFPAASWTPCSSPYFQRQCLSTGFEVLDVPPGSCDLPSHPLTCCISSAQSRFRTVARRGWLCEDSCVLPARLLFVAGDSVPSAEPVSPGIDSITWLGIQTDENHCDLSAGFIN